MLSTMPYTLHKGTHTLALPLNKPLPISKVFPREISGSYIERMNQQGQFFDKTLILFENGNFVIKDEYSELHPLQIIRLHLTREVNLYWDVNIFFRSHSHLKKEQLPPSTDYCKEKSLYLMQLCKLVYQDEKAIRDTLESRYDFDQIFYFSKATAHKRIVNSNRLTLLYMLLVSRSVVVDLQFMKLVKFDQTENRHVILLVFKGSDEAEDWVTNLSSQGVGFLSNNKALVHKGFQDALRLFIKTIKNSSFEIDGKDHSLDEAILPLLNNNSKIILTGHSLGGAIPPTSG